MFPVGAGSELQTVTGSKGQEDGAHLDRGQGGTACSLVILFGVTRGFRGRARRPTSRPPVFKVTLRGRFGPRV